MAGTTADYGQLCTEVLQEILHFPGIGAPQQATSLFTLINTAPCDPYMYSILK